VLIQEFRHKDYIKHSKSQAQRNQVFGSSQEDQDQEVDLNFVKEFASV